MRISRDTNIAAGLSRTSPVRFVAHKSTDTSTDVPTLWHEALEVKLFYSAGTELIIGGELFQAETSDIFIVSPLVPHSTYDSNPHNDYHLLNIDTAQLGLPPESEAERKLSALRRGELALPKLVRSAPGLKTAIERFETLSTGDANGLRLLACTYLLLDELLKLTMIPQDNLLPEKVPGLNYKLEPALNLMHNGYRHRITVGEMAGACGLDESYFCRLFRRRTGMTAVTYLNRIRIDNACILLAGSGKAIEEIAAECGFEDSGYFTRVFREYKGISPARYREKTR